MTNREILEKAIRRAIDGGWVAKWSSKNSLVVYQLLLDSKSDDGLEYNFNVDPYVYELSSPKAFIFNHDFCKALWGDKEDEFDPIISYSIGSKKATRLKSFEKHLQQMVVSEDPIKYLEKNI